ncbi:cytoplasmic protein [Thalassotalea sp. M1531]|uniref:Cytoplasmic protein n=1 Tax=Thalassotalea algicola TaxID=2716224 RepID=A0A7Y0LFP2_9GAMM|nr:cytoplasmic protein [Thalassotalea algicola]NMP32320.1 cytoplasmic protein [Thalassotalea algicola]
MALTVGNSGSVHVDSGNALEIKGAQLAKDQMELEGKMALELIQAAAVPEVNPPTVSSGNTINIKA